MNHHQTVASTIVLLLIAGMFSGCLNASNNISNTANLVTNLEKINLDNGLKLNPASYQVLPLLSSLIINRQINFEINESGTIIDDLSLFSSRIAISFWNESKEVFVVDSYRNLLLVSSLAKMSNAPVLIYGNTTKLAIDVIKPENVLSLGEVPVQAIKLSLEEIVERQAEIAKKSTIPFDYIALVNSNDSFSKIPGLSSFGALLACYHNGIVFEITDKTYPAGAINETNASEFLDRLSSFYAMLNVKGIKLSNVCIAGGADAIPQIVNETFIDKPPNYCPAISDNYYGNINGTAVFPELGVGRFLATNLVDAWKLFERYFNYYSYQDSDSLAQLAWQNSAFVYSTIDTGLVPSIERGALVFLNASFTTYQYNLDPVRGISESIVIDIMERSNFIRYMNHGTPDGFWGLDITKANLRPSVMFALSCSTGKIDGVDISDGVVYEAIHAGLAAYIAPTEVSWSGYAIPTTGHISFFEIGGDPLATAFFKRLCEQNMSVGIALKEAKIHYIDEAGFYPINPYWTDDDAYIAYQYTLYGDPAFNPYEPCNEGGQ